MNTSVSQNSCSNGSKGSMDSTGCSSWRKEFTQETYLEAVNTLQSHQGDQYHAAELAELERYSNDLQKMGELMKTRPLTQEEDNKVHRITRQVWDLIHRINGRRQVILEGPKTALRALIQAAVDRRSTEDAFMAFQTAGGRIVNEADYVSG